MQNAEGRWGLAGQPFPLQGVSAGCARGWGTAPPQSPSPFQGEVPASAGDGGLPHFSFFIFHFAFFISPPRPRPLPLDGGGGPSGPVGVLPGPLKRPGLARRPPPRPLPLVVCPQGHLLGFVSPGRREERLIPTCRDHYQRPAKAPPRRVGIGAVRQDRPGGRPVWLGASNWHPRRQLRPPLASSPPQKPCQEPFCRAERATVQLRVSSCISLYLARGTGAGGLDPPPRMPGPARPTNARAPPAPGAGPGYPPPGQARPRSRAGLFPDPAPALCETLRESATFCKRPPKKAPGAVSSFPGFATAEPGRTGMGLAFVRAVENKW